MDYLHVVLAVDHGSLPASIAPLCHSLSKALPGVAFAVDNRQYTGYGTLVIRSFKHKGLKRLFENGDRSGIRPDMANMVEDILGRLNESHAPQDMSLPGYRLHPLKGDLKRFWSVTVRANWRIVFRFENEDVLDVELIDYH